MDKPQLFSIEAEEALLGYLLFNPQILPTLDIEPTHFYLHKHRYIFEAFRALAIRGSGIDYVTIIDQLDRMGYLQEIGGAVYLAGLIDRPPLGHNPDDSVGIIRGYAQRRALLQVANDIAIAACDEKQDIGANTAKFIDRIAQASQQQGGAVHWGKYLSELYDDVDKRARDPKDIWGIPTGFARFDTITGGIQPGETLIMSGKPGVGKSMWAMQAALQMSSTIPGVIYSVEMRGMAVCRRMVSARAEIKTSALKSGRLDDGDWTNLVHAVDTLSERPIYMSDSARWTTTALQADLSRLKAQYGIQWFVFDYMLLCGDAPELKEYERTTIISRNMKLICRQLDLAGIVIHSMNKAGIASTTPGQEDLRGSGQVSYDADLIVFLQDYTPADNDCLIPKADQENMRTLVFGKGRELENPRRYLHMVKRPGYPVFADYVPDAAYSGNGRKK